LPLRNHSGDAQRDWLGPALAELLSGELGASERLRLAPGDAVARLEHELPAGRDELLPPSALERVRVALDARYVVFGSFASDGADGLQLKLRLEDSTTGGLWAQVDERGAAAELPE